MKKTFLASEVIVNDKGHIYHLDLHPDQIADVVVLVGDPDRVPKVSRYFDRVDEKAQHREFVTHTGTMGNLRMSCVSTGIGAGNIEIVMNEIDMLKNLDLATRTVKEDFQQVTFLRMGTCGSIQKDLDVGAFIFSEAAIGLDGLMCFYPDHSSEIEKQIVTDLLHSIPAMKDICVPYAVFCDTNLLHHFKHDFRTGLTVTSPSFYAGQGRNLRVPIKLAELPDLLTDLRPAGLTFSNFEMETAAILGMGKCLGHRAGSVSVVVANRPLGTFAEDGAKCVREMIEKTLTHLVSTYS